MKAMQLVRIADILASEDPLRMVDAPVPIPGDFEVLVRVVACGVCHTELDEIEGRLALPRLPLIPGHQVVGRVVGAGGNASRFRKGDRVGVGWIHNACGKCALCRGGRENLCAGFKGTGRDVDGGYAEYMTVPEGFAHPLPDAIPDAEAAPLLCAGAIGYRSLRLTRLEDGEILGLAGFGASAHLVIKLVRRQKPHSPVFVFAREEAERVFARELGAAWAGDFNEAPPDRMDAVIDTTPAWNPVLVSLAHLKPGGRLVINAIRKESADSEALLRMEYPEHLWMEKEIKSVANVTRDDIAGFLGIAADIPILPEVKEYPLEEANRALREMKRGMIRGAKVLRC
jgi:propanol-preferring alcohol dehydrogenase